MLLASTNRWRTKCWPKSISVFGTATSSQDGYRGKPFLISNWPITQHLCGDSGPDCTRPSVFYRVSQRMWASLKSSSWSLQWSWGRRWLEAEKKVKECTAEAIKSTQQIGVLSKVPTKSDYSLLCHQNFVNYNLLVFDLSELFCFSSTDFRGSICLWCFSSLINKTSEYFNGFWHHITNNLALIQCKVSTNPLTNNPEQKWLMSIKEKHQSTWLLTLIPECWDNLENDEKKIEMCSHKFTVMSICTFIYMIAIKLTKILINFIKNPDKMFHKSRL